MSKLKGLLKMSASTPARRGARPLETSSHSTKSSWDHTDAHKRGKSTGTNDTKSRTLNWRTHQSAQWY